MSDDLDMCCVNMRICFNEMRAESAGEKLWRIDWVFFGFDVNGVLHRVCGDYHIVVCLGISEQFVRSNFIEPAVETVYARCLNFPF